MAGTNEPSRLGHKVTISTAGEKAEAFVPPRLPPIPPIGMEVKRPGFSGGGFI